MTPTIQSIEGAADDVALTPSEPPPSTARIVLTLALAVFVLLAAVVGVVFVLVNDPPPTPAAVVEAAPTSTAPRASATPEERFLAAWFAAEPGVAARQGEDFWARIGTSTCNLVGRAFVTEDVVVRVLGSNPRLMSADEGRAFLRVARRELCPQNDYAPELQWPAGGSAPRVDLPDFGPVTAPRAGSPSIPTRTVSPPSVSVPRIPGSGSGGSSSGGSSGNGGSSGEPSVRPLPRDTLRPQPVT